MRLKPIKWVIKMHQVLITLIGLTPQINTDTSVPDQGIEPAKCLTFGHLDLDLFKYDISWD